MTRNGLLGCVAVLGSALSPLGCNIPSSAPRTRDATQVISDFQARLAKAEESRDRSFVWIDCERAPAGATCGTVWDEVSAGDKIERFVASVCHEEASQGISVGCKAEFRDLFLERVTKRYHFAPRDVVERSCADAEGQCGSLVLFELRFMELHNKSVLARYASEASSLRSRRDDALAEVRRDEEREAEERRAVAAMLRGVSAGLAAGAARTRSSVEPTLPMTYSASTEADPRIVVCSSDFACPYGQKCIKSQFSFEGVCVQPVDESGMRVITPPASSSIGLGQEGECSFTVECRLGFRCVKLGTDLRGHCLK